MSLPFTFIILKQTKWTASLSRFSRLLAGPVDSSPPRLRLSDVWFPWPCARACMCGRSSSSSKASVENILSSRRKICFSPSLTPCPGFLKTDTFRTIHRGIWRNPCPKPIVPNVSGSLSFRKDALSARLAGSPSAGKPEIIPRTWTAAQEPEKQTKALSAQIPVLGDSPLSCFLRAKSVRVPGAPPPRARGCRQIPSF